MQGLVGILSHTKGQVTTELLLGIGLKGFFSFIDVKLSAVGGCLEEVDVCLHWHHVFVGQCSCVLRSHTCRNDL